MKYYLESMFHQYVSVYVHMYVHAFAQKAKVFNERQKKGPQAGR
jgi:hypothetical protein